MFYNARWYDPALGRMAQADTIVPGAGNPMAWDRFAYVENNPIRNNDPTGHCINSNGNYVPGGPGGYGDPCPETAGNYPVEPVNGPIIPTPEPPAQSTPPYDLGTPSSGIPPTTCPYGQPSPAMPWELDRITGFGGVIDFGGMIPLIKVIGGNITGTVIYNNESGEVSLFLSGSGMGGFGEGASTSLGLVVLYDGVANQDLSGVGNSIQLTSIPVAGASLQYGASQQPGMNGKVPQTWALTIGGGAELSYGIGRSYSSEVLRYDVRNEVFYFLPWLFP